MSDNVPASVRKSFPLPDGDREEWDGGVMLMEDLQPGDQAVILDFKGNPHNIIVTASPTVKTVRKVSLEYSCATLKQQGTTKEDFPTVGFVRHVPPVTPSISEEEAAAAVAALMNFSFDPDE